MLWKTKQYRPIGNIYSLPFMIGHTSLQSGQYILNHIHFPVYRPCRIEHGRIAFKSPRTSGDTLQIYISRIYICRSQAPRIDVLHAFYFRRSGRRNAGSYPVVTPHLMGNKSPGHKRPPESQFQRYVIILDARSVIFKFNRDFNAIDIYFVDRNRNIHETCKQTYRVIAELLHIGCLRRFERYIRQCRHSRRSRLSEQTGNICRCQYQN